MTCSKNQSDNVRPSSGGGKGEEGSKNAAGIGSRALSITAGALAIALSIMIMVSPLFGIALAALVIGIALLVYGIRLVVSGISGRGDTMKPIVSQ